MNKTRKWNARTVMAVACVVAVPLSLAACATSPGTKSSASATTSKAHAKSPDPVDPRFTVTNNDAARRDVTLTTCQHVDGSWVAKGTVINSTSNAATYTLQIAYTDTQATVIGVEKTSVSPTPKQSLSWTTKWPSTMASGVVCVLDAVSRS
jgi:hypothetical protein